MGEFAALAALTAVSAGSAVAQNKAQSNAAKAQEFQLEREADAEKIKSTEQAIARRERLIRTLAARNARNSASGILTESGSSLTALSDDISEFQREDDTFQTLSGIRRNNLRAAGSNARRIGRQKQTATLINTAANTFGSIGE